MDLIFNLEEIDAAAKAFLSKYGDKKVFALNGAMGAGKTTFIRAICRLRSVKDTVGSPTFSIINPYHYEEDGKDKTMYHIDLYRLKDEEEAIRTGVEDCLWSGADCWVEWPGIAPGIFPDDTVQVWLEAINPNLRKLHTAG
jgi:tRNA threonylcarbamoyladenosine biosynthesis protein TsaE